MSEAARRSRRLDAAAKESRDAAGIAQAIIEATPIAVVNVDLHGRVEAWNPAAEHIFGWRRDEVIGRPQPYVPEEKESEYRGLLDRVMSGHAIHELETVRLRKNGTLVDVRLSAAPLRDSAGRVTGAVAFLADIGERKRTEQSLIETEGRYRTLFERNPFPMWAFDVETLRFLAVNDAAVEHYGYSREEFLEMSIKDIRPPDQIERLLTDVSDVAEGRVDPMSWNTAVWKHRKKDGTVFDVEVRSTTLSFGGWRARLVLAKDVSTERRLEEQLRQAQKMDAVGRLAGGIAHDFNNMLVVITGYADQLQRSLAEPLKHKAMEVLKAADRAATLTRQLLTFSRKEMEQPKVFDLNAVVSDMERMLRRLIGEQITLVATHAPDLWSVKADPGHIEQVLMNLAVNARDAMPDGGRLVIETKNVDLDSAYAQVHAGVQPGQYVMLSVSDTGIGMDAAVQRHIFEPFFTTKPKDKGTGLGLSIVYGIVKQSGGTIEVYSHPGLGTTFKVYLPRVAQEPDEAAQTEGKTLPSPVGSETILLSEDDDNVRFFTREILEEHGYAVLEALDLSEAIAVARERRPQLLVTDMVLQATTGSEIARQVRAVAPGIRVLYMSGYTDSALVSQGQIPQGAAFLQKPFTLETLLRKVRETLDQPQG